MKSLFTILAASVAICLSLAASSVPATRLISHTTSTSSSNSSCDTVASTLQTQMGRICQSLTGSHPNECCPASLPLNTSAHYDWIMQSVYYLQLLETVASMPVSCRSTDATMAALRFLNVSAKLNTTEKKTLTCSFQWTWSVFQFQYYVLPRPHPKERVESPDTLGEKSYAFSLLAQYWTKLKPQLSWALQGFIAPVAQMFESNIPVGFKITNQDCWSCWKNTTLDFKRNGTCPLDVVLFKGGFDYESIRSCILAPGSWHPGCSKNEKVHYNYYCH